jgi:D-aminoacyl-tRNA deacylase
MRAVIQRVSQANVKIDNLLNGSIDRGFMVLLGIEETDNDEDIDWLSTKIAQLRIFNDENGKMNKSIQDIDGNILLISQFTLHAQTKKGNRPSFIKAARPKFAIPLYKSFIEEMGRKIHKKIETGIFGANMQVSLINDGPVTICIDTKLKE